MKIRSFSAIILISLMLCSCANPVSSSSTTDTKTMNSGNSSIVQSAGEDSREADGIDEDNSSDKQFFVVAHATLSYDPTVIKKNDSPGDYWEIADLYENYTYYDDGSPLVHQVAYWGRFYEEHWFKDENGNVIEFDGKTGDDRITYVYDEDNRLYQEWRHRNYWPSSVFTYSDYDEYGNYGSVERIKSWGGSLYKQGDPWYDLDYIDYDEVESTTYRYFEREYDEKGRIISIIETRYDGSLERTQEYEYDNQGNLIYEYDSGAEYIREYHSNGKIALLQVKRGGEVKEETTYDTHGNPIKFIDRGVLTIYENEYDKYGNLVRQYTYNEEGNCTYYDIWEYVDKETYLSDDSYMDFLD